MQRNFLIRTAFLFLALTFLPFLISPAISWIAFTEKEAIESSYVQELNYDSELLSKFKTSKDNIYEMRVEKKVVIAKSTFLNYDTIVSFDTLFVEKKKYITTITFEK